MNSNKSLTEDNLTRAAYFDERVKVKDCPPEVGVIAKLSPLDSSYSAIAASPDGSEIGHFH